MNYYFSLENKIIIIIFNISENNIISVEATKVTMVPTLELSFALDFNNEQPCCCASNSG
jgi:hypothetical protein